MTAFFIIMFIMISIVVIRNIILEEKNEKLKEEAKMKDRKIENLERNVSELMDNFIEKKF